MREIRLYGRRQGDAAATVPTMHVSLGSLFCGGRELYCEEWFKSTRRPGCSETNG